jgi:ceramide glucosyltransferase
VPPIIPAAGLLLAAAAAFYSVASALLLWRRRETAGPAAPGATDARGRPALSILKPLCGAEAHLIECLRTFASLDYQPLQLVFGVRLESDPAIAVVRRLQQEFPSRDIVLVVDPRVHGENLKASNLINMLPHALHDIVLISDSDVRVPAGYLDAVVQALAPAAVGSVTCLYRGRPGAGLWSRVAALFVNDWYFPAILVSQALGDTSFASGVTIALRRSTIERMGGLSVLRDHLADDWLLCEHVRRLGLKTVLAPVVVQTEVSESGFAAHARRELRWMRTIRTVAPRGYAFMGLSIGLPMAVIGLALASGSPSLLPYALAAAALTLCARVVIHLQQRLRQGAGLGYDLMLIPLRDCLLLAVWLAGFLGRGVTWRGKRYRVRDGGALVPMNSNE